MELIPYTKTRYRKALKKLFHTAFPKTERPPFPVLRYFEKRSKSTLCAIEDNNTFVGLTLLTPSDDVLCVMYLAIDQNLRGKGYGSKALQKIKEQYADRRVILTLEEVTDDAPNREQRIKRKSFYEKNGFSMLPFTVYEYGVRYNVMTANKPVSKEEYEKLNDRFFGKWVYDHIILRTRGE